MHSYELGQLRINAEHWHEFGQSTGERESVIQAVAYIAVGEVPRPVPVYLKTRQITPFAEPRLAWTTTCETNHRCVRAFTSW